MTATTFSYTGAVQTFVVPPGMTSVQVECWGAQGGADGSSLGGKGGYALAFLAVTPGETLSVYVGGQGDAPASGYNVGGWNGGGRGYERPGGGGASDVRQGGNGLSNRAIIAGGGGGEGYTGGGFTGGGGPNNTGGRYNDPSPGFFVNYSGSGGGSQTTGGTGGTYGGTSGTLGQGGDGKNDPTFGGAGGGGGLYGGGGGGVNSGGTAGEISGGGGSGYVAGVANVFIAKLTNGLRSGNGQVVLTPLTPNAPVLAGPPNTTVLQAGNVNRFTWTFSSPISGDSQSGFDLQFRPIGASTWTTVPGVTPYTVVDLPAGTLPAPGDYEWQVRTYEAQGVVGPYSSSGFFTVATPTPAPAITAPVNGATVPLPAQTVAWSTIAQDAFQVQRVADIGGVADTTTVYFDSGPVADSAARTYALTFTTNSRSEHVRVRVQSAGLWSPWADVLITVAYTPPAVPALALTTSLRPPSIVLTATHPTPVTPQPAVTTMDVYMSTAGGDLERIAVGVPPSVAWTYAAPASGVDYAFMVRAFGSNGTSRDSRVVDTVTSTASPAATTVPGYEGGYLSGY